MWRGITPPCNPHAPLWLLPLHSPHLTTGEAGEAGGKPPHKDAHLEEQHGGGKPTPEEGHLLLPPCHLPCLCCIFDCRSLSLLSCSLNLHFVGLNVYLWGPANIFFFFLPNSVFARLVRLGGELAETQVEAGYLLN